MNYSDEERRLVKSILDKYDQDSLCIFTGDSARAFTPLTAVSAEILAEVWAICDTHCKGFLTREELSLFIRLLGYAQVDHDFRRPACHQRAGPIAILREWPASDGVEPPTTEEEGVLVSEIFREVDPDGFGILDMSAAEKILLRSGLAYDTLSAAWDLVDGPPPKGFLTPTELRRFLRLVGWAQEGVLPHKGLLTRSAPLPSFDDSWIPIKPAPVLSSVPLTSSTAATPFTTIPVPIPPSNTEPVLPPLTETDRHKFHLIFNRTEPINGLLDGEKSKRMLDKSKLPVNILAAIWDLADSKQRGALDSAEFIIAMYFVKCLMEKTISRLPSHLPPWLITAAAVPVTHNAPSSLPRPVLTPLSEVSLIDFDAPLPPLPVSPTSSSRSTPTRHRHSQSSSVAVRPASARGSISSRHSISHGRPSSNPSSRAFELPPGQQAPPGITPTGDQTQRLELAHSGGGSEPPPPYSAMEGTSLSA